MENGIETGWLLDKPEKQLAFGVDENEGKLKYGKVPCWLPYTHPGVVRFAREIDAKNFLESWRSFAIDAETFTGVIPTEHSWG